MGDRQEDDKSWLRVAIACGNETGRPIFSQCATSGRFPRPQVVIADYEARRGLGNRHEVSLLQQLIESGMLGIHLRAFDCLEDDCRHLVSPMSPL